METNNLKIHFLGTGSSSPNKDRSNSSLLFEFRDRAVLVDASGYPGQSIPRAGVSFERLHDVILTHGHVDHIYALPSLLSSIASYDLSGETKVLRLHGLSHTLEVARRLLEIFIEPSQSMAAVKIEYNYVDPEPTEMLTLNLADWMIPVFRVNHGGIPALGLTLKNTEGRQIVYSGDTIADELIRAQVTPETTCLIHDCASGLAMTPRTQGHAGAAELNQLLRLQQPRATYITHLSARQEAVLPQMLEVLAQNYTGSVAAAHDGMVLTF